MSVVEGLGRPRVSKVSSPPQQKCDARNSFRQASKARNAGTVPLCYDLCMSVENPRKSRARFIVEEIGKIKFDRTPTAVSNDPEYFEHLPQIAELYKDTEFWHGTGRFKFSQSGDVEDILQGMIKEGGLMPREDDWDRQHGIIHTVSVSPSRMYARLYAGMYCPAGTHIKNELGTRELWGYYFFGTSGILGMLEYRPNLRQIRRGDDSSSFIPDFGKKTEQWVSKASVQKHNIKDIFLHGTDIAENYPILIGVKHSAVQPTHGSRFINLHEKRTESPILLNDISHIEVPRARVEETQVVLSENGHTEMKILPIEFGEEYCRKFPFRKLVGSSAFK